MHVHVHVHGIQKDINPNHPSNTKPVKLPISGLKHGKNRPNQG